MPGSAKHLLIIFCLIAIYTTGIFLFTKGFLLTRLVVNENSSCHVDFAGHMDIHGHKEGKSGCWMFPHFKKAVIVIIDALRFDFVAINSSSEAQQNPLPFQNKLKSLDLLLKQRPSNSRLYRFIADPPTTTLQRLKGLTTGSLPTFVDAGSNFAGSEITEDNIVDQLLKLGKKITFMGDDTWTGLFPNRFHRMFPFPSLNVKDLHTVDNGVLSHLIPELKRTDWDVLIAHFLGVDHCGHRYGPYHPAMGEKLTQMDETLSSLIKALDKDTLLVVLGDHGMTRSGDHGGDSWDELQAALFLYSHSQITSSHSQQMEFSKVSQVDLVPTLSLLLGTPIPFSNLGTVIPDLFSHCPSWKTPGNTVKQLYHTVSALHLNAHQIKEYISSYSKLSEEFPREKLSGLNRIFHQAEKDLQMIVNEIHHGGEAETVQPKLEMLNAKYLEYLSGVKEMCQSVWAKFDLSSICLGITVTLTAVVANFLLIYDAVKLSCKHSFWILCVTSWVVILSLFLYVSEMKLRMLLASLVMGLGIIGSFALVLYKVFQSHKIDEDTQQADVEVSLLDKCSILCLLLYFLSLFSNSFVVNEDAVTAFLFKFVLFGHFVQICTSLYKRSTVKAMFNAAKKSKQNIDIGRLFTSPGVVALVLTVAVAAGVRSSEMYRACREEQLSCDPTSFLQPLSSLTGEAAHSKNVRYFFSAASVILVPVFLRFWLRFHGNLNGYSPCVVYVVYGLPASALCVLFYWALQSLPVKIYENLPVWQLTIFPRIVYIISLCAILVCVLKPLTIFTIKRDKNSEHPLVYPSGDNFIPRAFSHLKENLQRHLMSNDKANEDDSPMVYGLATVYSSTVLVAIASVVMVIYLTLGDGMAGSLILHLIAKLALLELMACANKLRFPKGDTVPWSSVFCWCLLASEHFFTSGHQATVTSIRWEAAYNGFHGDFESYIIPASLITINTFATYILATVGLPLVLFWIFSRGRMLYRFQKLRETADTVNKGEFILNEDKPMFQRALVHLVLSYILFFGVRLLATMCCAGLLRRHLMVWKIFAPRFVYEGATFFLVSGLVIFVYLLVIRVDKAVDNWVQSL